MADEAKGGALEFHPMDQFIVKPLFPEYGQVVSVDGGTGTLSGGQTVNLSADQISKFEAGENVKISLYELGLQTVNAFTITNATLWFALAIVAVVLLLVFGTSRRAIVPTRSQSIAELIYGFVHKMVEDVCGKEGLKYFPYIMTLFMFILVSNFLGLLPMAFTTTSHIAVTAVLAMAVFLAVTILGFVKNGAGFLSLFWVSSAPLALRPILALIEVISYFVRPVSHSIRLAGNMMAGHAVIKVFAGFAAIAAISPLSVLAVTAMYGLEVLVSAIQAYVFTILTCVYLKDALHPHH
ncbi:ATP synthase F0 subcomplex A subunit [Litoreibacter ponti]|uniref:ATP synthase subunit a n=1 Tax=Litoreibacter ponti TaxID=1510457 RepID=A0A2T6BEC2_9RHOB|nr:F0F1 ATP synthase subunit A [Litoreibacter ponti]PTX54409.1 ATP synthase F0 subcomplex A subunit [Litoreibacter ponti]